MAKNQKRNSSQTKNGAAKKQRKQQNVVKTVSPLSRSKDVVEDIKKPNWVVRTWRELQPLQRVALFGAAVGTSLLGTSLIHLAHGVERITGDHVVLAWAVAIGIDLSIVSMKLTAVVSQSYPVWSEIKKVTNFTLGASLILSAGLNILSYIEGRTDSEGSPMWTTPDMVYLVLCIILGIYIPFAVWAQSYNAAKLWSYYSKKQAGGPPRKRKSPVAFHSDAAGV